MLDRLRKWLKRRTSKDREQGGEIYNIRDKVSSVRPYKEISDKMTKHGKGK